MTFGVTIIAILELFYFHQIYIYNIQIIKDIVTIEFTKIKRVNSISCHIDEIKFKSENFAKGTYRLLITYKEKGKKENIFQMENSIWDKKFILEIEQILNEYKLKEKHLKFNSSPPLLPCRSETSGP